MNRNLYLFNPDHDLALANGNENYGPPQSAAKFAADLSALPLWYAEQGNTVWANVDIEWIEKIRSFFPSLESVNVDPQPDFSAIRTIYPWGWNAAIRKQLSLNGAESQILPKQSQLNILRNLSHRETAIKALEYLKKDPVIADYLPIPARTLLPEDISAFAASYPEIVFKAPWSGSGKGIYWSSGELTKSTVGWCRKVASKQGCVIGEEAYDKVQDLAMEFFCENGRTSFAGYSLFETVNGVYRSNELLSDDAIVATLTESWVPLSLLELVQQHLIEFLDQEIAPHYQGYLGVDMFVYFRDGEYRLHPCVEINLRMTMGAVARIFYDRFVDPSVTGRFYIDYLPKPGALLADHKQCQQLNPLKVIDDRICSGYLSLIPITGNSLYRVRVEVL